MGINILMGYGLCFSVNFYMWNFRIMDWRMSKELQNPDSIWGCVLSEMCFLGSQLSLRIPPLQGLFPRPWGVLVVCLPNYVLAKFAEEIYIECNQLRSLFLSILS